MSEKHRVSPGYYAMALYDAYTNLESMIPDESNRAKVPSALDRSTAQIATVAADADNDCFYMVRQLASGGVVVFLGCNSNRRDTPLEAFNDIAENEPSIPPPLAVMWLGTLEMVMH